MTTMYLLREPTPFPFSKKDWLKLFSIWLNEHFVDRLAPKTVLTAPNGDVSVDSMSSGELYRRLNLNVAGVCTYRRGDTLPHFDNLIRLIDFFDPQLAGIMEHFFDPDAGIEDYRRLTPQRARSLFWRWLNRRLHFMELNKFQLSREMGIRSSGVYLWFTPHPTIPNTGKEVPNFLNLMKLMEVLDPPLFGQIIEQFNVKEEK